MSLTSHNQFFGWVHSFKISRYNSFFNQSKYEEKPYPVIVDQPTISQVINNWNYADTGFVITCFTLGIFISKSMTDKIVTESLLRKRIYFKRYVNIFTVFGFFFGLQNSANRLSGFVPNGLPKKRNQQVIKYDFTSQFMSQTPWKYLVQGHSKSSSSE